MRPRCCFLYFTFLGINMRVSLQYFDYSGFSRGGSGGVPASEGAELSCFNSCFQLGCGGANGGRIGAGLEAGPKSGGADCVAGPLASIGATGVGTGGRRSRRSRSGGRRGSGSLRSESRRGPPSKISPLYVQHLIPITP